MPKFKLSGVKAVEQKTGFEPYDGPEPTRNGFYRGLIKVLKWGDNSSGSQGFSMTLELEAAPGDPKGHGVFDGYPMFSRSIITAGKDGEALKEGAQRNLSNFLAALGVKDEPEVILAEGDGDKVDVKKIGGKNPIGIAVNIDLQMKLYEGDRRPEVGGIYKYKETDAPTGTGRASVLDDEEEPEDESDLLDESEEAEETEGDEADEYDARAEELAGLGIPALKKIAKELEIGVSGTKDKLIERILEAEFTEEEEAEDEEEPDDEPESEDEEEAEDDEAEDDEEEEEDDEDEAAKAERIAELAEINRVGLKKILKEIAPDTTVLKRHTDDDLREQIIAVEFEEDLPF